MVKKKLAGLLTVIYLAAFMAAGCGGNQAETTATAAASETENTSAARETENTSAARETEAETEKTEDASETTEKTSEGVDEVSYPGVDFARTYGLWRLDGEPDTAFIVMDGEGGFFAYYADGALETSGYIEYVDEYDDGNGRYDLMDTSGEFFTGFYFDSDTQFHIGNGDGPVYIRDDSEYIETTHSAGVLVYSPGYTGLTSLEVNNDYHGGYYYKDMTEDTLTVIVNTAFEMDLGVDEYPEDMIARKLELIESSEAREIVISSDDDQSARFTYPTYYVTWLTGYNEDTTDWTAMFVLTDGYTYAYAYGTDADFAEEMKETWYDSFERMELIFPDEE